MAALILLFVTCYARCFLLLSAVRVEFVKDRYTVETADTRMAIVCLTKAEGAIDFDVTVEARPEEITSEDFNLGEGEELAKGQTMLYSNNTLTVYDVLHTYSVYLC